MNRWEWEYEQYQRRKRTRNEKNRAKRVLTTTILVWALIIAAILCAHVASICAEGSFTPQEENASEAPLNAKLEGRLPGDDIPATERCFLTEEEVRELNENELIEAALLGKATVIEGVTITHYCSELYPHICGTGDGITASGRRVTPYVSVAVDPDVIPLGSDVLVDYGDGEIHYHRADDVGGWVKGNHIDVAVTTHDEALQLGRKTATVYWREGGRE